MEVRWQSAITAWPQEEQAVPWLRGRWAVGWPLRWYRRLVLGTGQRTAHQYLSFHFLITVLPAFSSALPKVIAGSELEVALCGGYHGNSCKSASSCK